MYNLISWIVLGTQGGSRTRKPMAYRVSCTYSYVPHLNLLRSFQILICLNLEDIYTRGIKTIKGQSMPFIYLLYQRVYFPFSQRKSQDNCQSSHQRDSRKGAHTDCEYDRRRQRHRDLDIGNSATRWRHFRQRSRHVHVDSAEPWRRQYHVSLLADFSQSILIIKRLCFNQSLVIISHSMCCHLAIGAGTEIIPIQ